ncbi:MAG: type pilus assembly protein PilB, partial [Candidatus Hydrogenedentes bacterium]|nr:type pilus assembly protein PilB [Candidatus Hydrogenedentota bacterium]
MPKVSLLLLRCPCGHVLHALPDALGKKVTCVKCGRRSMVTAQNTRAVQKMVTQAPVRTTAPVMPTERKRLGEMMVDAGLVTRDELNAALEIQARDGGKLAETLIRQGCLNMRAFVDFLAKQPGVASIDIYSYSLSDAYVKLVPKRLALEHEVFPLDKLGNLLTVAMACPLDTEAIQELERITGLRIKPLLCSPGDIKSVITRYYPREEDVAAVKPPQPAPPLPSPHTADQKPSEPVENVFTAPPPVPVSAEPAPAVPSAFFLLDDEDEPEPESLPPLTPEVAVDRPDAGGFIDGWKALPTLWTTLARIRSVAASSTTQLSDVANIVGKDPSLAATILGEANNPAYGLPGAVKSIEAAILLIGTHRTYLVGLAAPLFDWRACETLFDYPT